MAFSSSIGPYKEADEPWENYELRLEAWMAVNNIQTGAGKRNALIAEIGPAAFSTLKDLAYPAAVSDRPYPDLIQLLRNHFKVSITPMVSKFTLHRRKQRENETVSEYIAALKKIAAGCGFGDE